MVRSLQKPTTEERGRCGAQGSSSNERWERLNQVYGRAPSAEAQLEYTS